MSVSRRSPALPAVALYLGLASVALLALGFVVDTVATAVEMASRSVANVLVVLGGFAFVSAPIAGVAAIATGIVSLRRHPDRKFGLAGLILGCVALGLVLLAAILFVVTWLSIRPK